MTRRFQSLCPKVQYQKNSLHPEYSMEFDSSITWQVGHKGTPFWAPHISKLMRFCSHSRGIYFNSQICKMSVNSSTYWGIFFAGNMCNLDWCSITCEAVNPCYLLDLIFHCFTKHPDPYDFSSSSFFVSLKLGPLKLGPMVVPWVWTSWLLAVDSMDDGNGKTCRITFCSGGEITK